MRSMVLWPDEAPRAAAAVLDCRRLNTMEVRISNLGRMDTTDLMCYQGVTYASANLIANSPGASRGLEFGRCRYIPTANFLLPTCRALLNLMGGLRA